MAKVVPLFSSSKGNSYYVQGNDSAILIDAGRSCKQIENALMINNISMQNVGAIFVTHEHIDHCRGLKVLSNRYKIPVYATRGTMEALIEKDYVDVNQDLRVIDNLAEISDFEVTVVSTSHDANESCGYLIKTPDDKKLSIVTDTGFILDDARTKMRMCDAVIIESNHDIKMLEEGLYPFTLKKRIRSMTGHLSNDDCAKELPALVKSGVKRIMLAHLSQENNTREKALKTAVSFLQEAGYEQDIDYTITVAPVETNGKGLSF